MWTKLGVRGVMWVVGEKGFQCTAESLESIRVIGSPIRLVMDVRGGNFEML